MCCTWTWDDGDGVGRNAPPGDGACRGLLGELADSMVAGLGVLMCIIDGDGLMLC